jgi:Ca-activated chloride channel family protein
MVPPLAQLLPDLALPLWGAHQLAAPVWLLALLLFPLLAWLRRRRPVSTLLIPHAAAWAAPRPSPARRWPVRLGYAAAGLLVVALARPQRVDDTRIIRGEGYDIVIAIDLSTSMFAEDNVVDGSRVNRLEALKPVLEAFIRRRPSDRIGFVAFAGRAYTLAPLTHDHAWLARQVDRLRIGLIEDGTAIGDGLGLSLTRLHRARTEADAPRAGAFVILMTDGAHNRGTLTPEQSTALAKARGVPVFTIGVGQDGLVPFPAFDEHGRRIGTTRRGSDLDLAALRKIASETGGRFFRAEDPDAASAAFTAIDRAQKVSFDQSTQVLATELYAWPAAASALLLFLAALPLLRRPAS